MASTPKENAAFWHIKFEQNVERDRRKEKELEQADWKVVIVWECETKKAALPILAERLCSILVNTP